MKPYRQQLLRANALFLGIAATGGLVSDIKGSFFGQGHVATILASAPHAAIGFVEAHGLALIFAFLLWTAPVARKWHASAAAVHLLLGTSNFVFWQIFISADMLAVGYVSTALHALFATLQLVATAAPIPAQAGFAEKPRVSAGSPAMRLREE